MNTLLHVKGVCGFVENISFDGKRTLLIQLTRRAWLWRIANDIYFYVIGVGSGLAIPWWLQ